MIVYRIATGEIWACDTAVSDQETTCSGTLLGHGYSGNGSGLNNPLATDEKGHGPLPVGWYTIGTPEDRPQSVGAFALPLTPDPENEMFDRSAFFCHGDNPQADHTASDGCIVAPRPVREIVAQHQRLQVIP